MKGSTIMNYQANIRSYYDRASADQIAEGRAWYPSMAATLANDAARSGLRIAQVAAVYAANSINTPWARNLALASRAIADHAAGRDALCDGGTLGMIIGKVRAAIAATSDDAIDGIMTSDPHNLKIVNFRRNLIDDPDAVTVDRWAFRIATNFEGCECVKANTHGCGKVPTGNEYRAIADAYRAVASEVGERAHDLQAITWCVVRGTGE